MAQQVRLLFQRSWVQVPATSWCLTTTCNEIWCPLVGCLKTATVYLHIINKSFKKYFVSGLMSLLLHWSSCLVTGNALCKFHLRSVVSLRYGHSHWFLGASISSELCLLLEMPPPAHPFSSALYSWGMSAPIQKALPSLSDLKTFRRLNPHTSVFSMCFDLLPLIVCMTCVTLVCVS